MHLNSNKNLRIFIIFTQINSCTRRNGFIVPFVEWFRLCSACRVPVVPSSLSLVLCYSIQRTQHEWPPASNRSRYHNKYHVIISCVSFYCFFDDNVALLITTRYSNFQRPPALRNSFQSSFAKTDFKEAVCIIK